MRMSSFQRSHRLIVTVSSRVQSAIPKVFATMRVPGFSGRYVACGLKFMDGSRTW
jgi:hypothetical protein